MKNNTTNTGGETTMATKSYKTTELQDRLAERLAATEYAPGRTFAGSWWGRGDRAERFYFGDSANMRKDGKVIRNKVWLQFDDPASLEGCSLRVEAKKAWHKSVLAKWHQEAFAIAVEMDAASGPEVANRFREDFRRHAQEVGTMVQGEDD
jgi:hypothetical protein